MYKMLVLDLDGTLLNDDKLIPEENIEAINKLYKDFGIVPVIATARPLKVARYIADQGGDAFQSYIIATNGAILMDIEKDEYLVDRSLDSKQIEDLIKVCEDNDLEYEFMTTECEVADSKYSYRRVIDPMYDNMGIPFNFQNDLKKYSTELKEPIPLFAISGTEKELQENYSKISQVKGIQIAAPSTRTTPGDSGEIEDILYHDIMKEGVTKASAIEILANHLKINKNEIIAIGDGGNDIEMLQTAGLKIAMSNASDSLKEIADIITEVDNNHGGVGAILNEVYKQLERHNEKISQKSGFEFVD